ncbi:MAG: ferredoxin family protein [Amphritea sp.]
MSYVILAACVDIKDGACAQVCPVDCIYEGGRMFYIQPDECVNCGLCESVCPVDAIRPIDEVSDDEQPFVAANAEFFGAQVTDWGDPGGWNDTFTSDKDHPLIESMPAYSAAAEPTN